MTAFKKEKRRLDFVTRKFVIHSLRDIARCYCSRQVLLFINDKRKKDIQFRGVSLSSQSAKLVSVVVSTPQLSSSKSLAKHLLHSLTKTKGTKRKEKGQVKHERLFAVTEEKEVKKIVFFYLRMHFGRDINVQLPYSLYRLE